MGIREEKTKLRAYIKTMTNSALGKAIMQNANVLQEDEAYCRDFLKRMS